MENNVKEKKNFTHETIVTLRMLNPEGNMYFSKYFGLLGDTREVFALNVIPQFAEIMGHKAILKTVETSMKYKKDFYFGDTVRIQLWISKIKEASLVLSVEFVNNKNNEIHAFGEQIIAFLSKEGKIISIPDDWKILLEEYFDDKQVNC